MPAIYLRKAKLSDLEAVSKLINEAKIFMKNNQIDQWQNGYPNKKDFKIDIESGVNYVLICDGRVAGTASLIPGVDPHYLQISHGSWSHQKHDHYATIHRVAISSQFRGKGLSKFLMSNLISLAVAMGYYDIRIDTHPHNQGMQHVITSNGFKKRGITKTENGSKTADSPRYAYQLII